MARGLGKRCRQAKVNAFFTKSQLKAFNTSILKMVPREGIEPSRLGRPVIPSHRRLPIPAPGVINQRLDLGLSHTLRTMQAVGEASCFYPPWTTITSGAPYGVLAYIPAGLCAGNLLIVAPFLCFWIPFDQAKFPTGQFVEYGSVLGEGNTQSPHCIKVIRGSECIASLFQGVVYVFNCCRSLIPGFAVLKNFSDTCGKRASIVLVAACHHRMYADLSARA